MRKTYYDLLEEIKNFFKCAHYEKAVVALSGGLDSAVTLRLVADAIQKKNVTALIMPEEGLTGPKNTQDAIDYAAKLRIKHFVCPINPFLNSLSHISWKQSKLALMNTKARVRGMLLYNYANSNNALVVGTSNKSELLLGYGTKHGDLAADVFVLGGLLKTDVIELAKFMDIPEHIIKKKPSAELTVGQTDEAELGATYLKLDSILKKHILEEKLNRKDYLVKRTLQRIERNKHKHDPTPVITVK